MLVSALGFLDSLNKKPVFQDKYIMQRMTFVPALLPLPAPAASSFPGALGVLGAGLWVRWVEALRARERREKIKIGKLDPIPNGGRGREVSAGMDWKRCFHGCPKIQRFSPLKGSSLDRNKALLC